MARAILRDGAGVVAADIDDGGLADVAREGARTMRVDVTLAEQVRELVALSVERRGRVDTLFNNAGMDSRCEIEAPSRGTVRKFGGVHLFGALYALRSTLPIMRAEGYGRAINMLSRGAEAREPGWAADAPAKAGLFALTRVAAGEMRGSGVLINCMIPGPTHTRMNNNPSLQPPQAVCPSALWLATLPDGGPPGRCSGSARKYNLFALDRRVAIPES